MKKKGTWVYLALFALLTIMCWSPYGYGSYGPAERTFGMPTWTVVALAAGTLLFILEWIFLFFSGLALEDEEVSELVASLRSAQDDSVNDSASKRKVMLP